MPPPAEPSPSQGGPEDGTGDAKEQAAGAADGTFDPATAVSPPAAPAEDALGDVDELGTVFGPDEHGAGLFDRSGGETTGTGEATASTVAPGVSAHARRVALLAWIAAEAPVVGTPLPPLSPAAIERARARLRRLRSEEPPEFLPVPDGIAAGGPTPLPEPRPSLREEPTLPIHPPLPPPDPPPPPHRPAAAPDPAPTEAPPPPPSVRHPLAPPARAVPGLAPLVAVVLLILTIVALLAEH